MIRAWLVVPIGLALLVPGAAGQGVKAQCVGGTLAGSSSKLLTRLDLTGPEAMEFACGKTEFRIPYKRIGAVEYGQLVSRRYAAALLLSPMLLLSKERRHYVTLAFADERDAQQAIVFRVDKADIRSMLASLEARTGRRVEYQDDEARKGAKE
jgi:hypothetical protein